MIPKVIHYCWFGPAQLDPLSVKCIGSWKRFLPDHEIKRWSEENFDVNMIPYIQEAYQAKKYAFVSDYARFWILYNYGGIYFDTDVEVIAPLDDILARGAFMGCEGDGKNSVATGLGIAAPAKLPIMGDIVDMYSKLHFLDENGNQNMTTVVTYISNFLLKRGLPDKDGIQFIEGIYVYPKDYFSPKSYVTLKTTLTENTRSIHHYASSWIGTRKKWRGKLRSMLPENIYLFLRKTFRENNI